MNIIDKIKNGFIALRASNGNEANINASNELLVKNTDVETILTDRTQKTIITDGTNDVDTIAINGNRALVALSPGHVSTDNSTSTPLTGDELYTGVWEIISNFGVVVVTLISDKASATNGFMIEFSSDGINVDIYDNYTIPALTGKTFTFQTACKYFRIKYTNGTTEQTYFRLQTTLKPYYVKPSSHRIQDAITTDDDAELVKAVITGKNPAGNFVNFQSTTSGNFKVSLEEFENQVSVNSNTQLRTTQFDSSGNEIESQQLLSNTDDLDDKVGVVTASALYARTNGKVAPLISDLTSHALTTIDYGHHEIHQGDHFYIKNWIDLTNGQVLDFLVVTPDTTKWTHVVVEFAFEAEANVVVYEGTTTSANGASVTVYNRNRNSATSNTTLVYAAPTVTGVGTQVAAYKAGSGRGAGGTVRANQELVIKQNTKYLIRITNDVTTNNWCDYLADWYEHTNLS